ncbi:MAG: hypothetical protein MUP40_06390 [Actinobacteria bacterium]|nr:hypothetical protein [Actinomycetota bacterium]
MEATILLCDYAEAVNGKLYVMGGGWTNCPPGIRSMSVAVRALVPWLETNTKHKFNLMLQNENGNTVTLGEPPKEVKGEGEFEVGRPPGIVEGTELPVSVVLTFNGLPLEPEKGYRWQLEINGEPAGRASFRTWKAQSGPIVFK